MRPAPEPRPALTATLLLLSRRPWATLAVLARALGVTGPECEVGGGGRARAAALAPGADLAVHVECDEENLEPLAVAKLLQAVVASEEPDIVILGKQAIDGDCNQTGQILAGLMEWPQATFASELNIADDNSSAEVTREVDAGMETIKISLPAVVTADLRLNEPRYATLPNIMKARKKKIQKHTAEELGVDTTPRLSVLSVADPPEREAGIRGGELDELIGKREEDGKS